MFLSQSGWDPSLPTDVSIAAFLFRVFSHLHILSLRLWMNQRLADELESKNIICDTVIHSSGLSRSEVKLGGLYGNLYSNINKQTATAY